MDYGIAARQQQNMGINKWRPPQDFKGVIPTLRDEFGKKIKPAAETPTPVAPAMADVMPKAYGVGPQFPAATPVMPVKGFDEGGKVNVQEEPNKAPTGPVDQAVEYLRNLYGQTKAFFAPYTNEKSAMQEKQQQVNQVTPAPAPVPAAPTDKQFAPWDYRAPKPGPYGTGLGEKGPEQVLKPSASTQPETRYRVTPTEIRPVTYAKVYDEGGEVDTEDDEEKKDHQLALLSDGERVLTPEEAAAYEKEHPEVKKDGREGKPVGKIGDVDTISIGGDRYLPNPGNVKPVSDTDLPWTPGAKVEPETKIEGNPDPEMVAPVPTTQQPQRVTPMPNEVEGQPQGGLKTASTGPQPIVPQAEMAGAEPQPYGPVKQPSYQPGKEPAPAPPDPTAAIHEELERRKGEAAMKGDFLGLGAAIIGQRAMVPVYGGPIAETKPETKPATEPELTGPAAYKAKIANYDRMYQQALDEFTPEGKERAANIREAKLEYERAHPWGSPESPHPGVGGKIAHALADVGNVAGAVMAPAVEEAIPQSMLGRKMQQEEAEKMAAAAPKEHGEEAGAKMTEVETAQKQIGVPKMITQDGIWTSPEGKRYQAYEEMDGQKVWVPEGQTPPTFAQMHPNAKQDMFSAESQARLKNIGQPQAAPGQPAVPPVAGPQAQQPSPSTVEPGTPGPNGVITGSPKGGYFGEKPDAEHLPASPAEVQHLQDMANAIPGLTDAQRKGVYTFPQGYTPTAADIKSRIADVDKLTELQRQNKQDELNNQLRKIASETQQMLAGARMDDEKLKHDKALGDNARNAMTAYSSLYAQEAYNDAVKKWQQSPSYAKDVVLVTNLIADLRKGDEGNFKFGTGGDVTIGAVLGTVLGGGPVGGAVGAGIGSLVGTAQSIIEGPASAALETLKKNGTSQAGLDAMQAYFNTLPGRMNFEVNTMKMPASSMRMRDMIRTVMNTVPQPNHPPENWDSAFNRYYKNMESLTKRSVKLLDLPEGFTVPSREELGYPAPPPPPQEKLPQPKGTKFIGKSKADGLEYYLDASHNKLGPVFKAQPKQ